MKQTKFILANLFTACYTSLWWGFGVFGNEESLILIPIILMSLAMVMAGLIYLFQHWDEN